MARIIIHTAKGPHAHTTPNGETVYICMCGLSGRYPLCDGSHIKTRDEAEDTVYLYDGARNRLASANLENLRKV